jgi:hypothetical protein
MLILCRSASLRVSDLHVVATASRIATRQTEKCLIARNSIYTVHIIPWNPIEVVVFRSASFNVRLFSSICCGHAYVLA